MPMDVLNNVNLEKMRESADALRRGEVPPEKDFTVEGEWSFGDHQFRAVLEFERGRVEVFTDQPTPAGGKGNAPNPVQYCVFAMVACYSTTFMSIAAKRGVEITSLRVRGYSRVNMRAVFDLEEGPVVKEVGVHLEVESDAPVDVLEEIREEANRKCPAAFTVSNSVPFKSTLEVRNNG